MQFGIFSVSDITRDPVSGETPSEAERIDAITQIAQKTEEVGLDVFAIGEHHNPPFFSSSPTTLLAYIAATTKRLIVTTATTLITTNDPVRIAEEYAMLQHLSKGRMDLMIGRGNTGPVYPWFGQDIRQGLPLALENYNLLHRLWREDVVDWEGKFRTPLAGLHLDPAAAGRRAAVRLARLDPHPRDRRAGGLLRRRLLRQQHLLAQGALPAPDQVLPAALRALRPRHRAAGPHRPGRPGLPRQELPGRHPRVPALLQRGAGLRARAVHGGLLDLTPLSVGSPQQVIDKTLTFREHFGDYQRQLFLVDHAGLPLKTVLDQLDLLGEEVVPVLRKEIAARQDPQTPDAPTHASLVKARYGDEAPRQPRPNANRGDNVTGASPYQDSADEFQAEYPEL